MTYLKNIDRIQGQNMGGLLQLQVIRKDDVTSIPDPVNGVIYGDIITKPGKDFTTWLVTPGSAQFISEDQTTQEGVSRRNRLPFFVPKDTPDLKLMFRLAQDDEHIIISTDSNGVKKIFGSLDSPARFEFRHDTSNASAGRNGYSCQFIYEGPDNVNFYDGQVTSPPSGTAPALVVVNGVTIAALQPGEVLNVTTDYDFDHQIIGA